MCVLAHPDDESLCVGGTIARYAAEGVEICLVVATRGERGWRGEATLDPGLKRVGQIRQGELQNAAHYLGVREIYMLDYVDGEVVAAPFQDLVSRIVRAIRQFRPDIVITFDPHGMYGHPDHIAISQATATAIVNAADAGYDGAWSPVPHRVLKLYYRVYSERSLEKYQEIFGTLKMSVENVERGATPWRDWAITTRIQTHEYSGVMWKAIACHRSQFAVDESMHSRFNAYRASERGGESYYRVLSAVNVGRGMETDLFDGVEVSPTTQDRPRKMEEIISVL